MKKLLATLFFIVTGVPFSVWAQTCFFSEGTQWTEVIYDNKYTDYSKGVIGYSKIEGDSVLGDHTYKKVYARSINWMSDSGWFCYLLLREEEGGNIYVRKRGAQSFGDEKKLYSFNEWKVGSTVCLGGKEVRIEPGDLTSIRLEDGNEYPFYLKNEKLNAGFVWGIGSLRCVHTPDAGIEEIYDGDLYLKEFYRDGKLLYVNKEIPLLPESVETRQMESRIRILNPEKGTAVFWWKDGMNPAEVLSVYSIEGRKLSDHSMESGKIVINSLPAGIYLYKVRSAKLETIIVESGRFYIAK